MDALKQLEENIQAADAAHQTKRDENVKDLISAAVRDSIGGPGGVVEALSALTTAIKSIKNDQILPMKEVLDRVSTTLESPNGRLAGIENKLVELPAAIKAALEDPKGHLANIEVQLSELPSSIFTALEAPKGKLASLENKLSLLPSVLAIKSALESPGGKLTSIETKVGGLPLAISTALEDPLGKLASIEGKITGLSISLSDVGDSAATNLGSKVDGLVKAIIGTSTTSRVTEMSGMLRNIETKLGNVDTVTTGIRELLELRPNLSLSEEYGPGPQSSFDDDGQSYQGNGKGRARDSSVLSSLRDPSPEVGPESGAMDTSTTFAGDDSSQSSGGSRPAGPIRPLKDIIATSVDLSRKHQRPATSESEAASREIALRVRQSGLQERVFDPASGGEFATFAGPSRSEDPPRSSGPSGSSPTHWEEVFVGSQPPTKSGLKPEMRNTTSIRETIKKLIHKADLNVPSKIHRTNSVNLNDGRPRICWLTQMYPRKDWPGLAEPIRRKGPQSDEDIQARKDWWETQWPDTEEECPMCQFRRDSLDEGEAVCFYFSDQEHIKVYQPARVRSGGDATGEGGEDGEAGEAGEADEAGAAGEAGETGETGETGEDDDDTTL